MNLTSEIKESPEGHIIAGIFPQLRCGEDAILFEDALSSHIEAKT